MSWLLFLLYAAVLFYVILKVKFFHLEGLKRWTPAIFFGLKLVAAFALWWIYTFYYTDRENSDIWKYFDDSKVMYDALAEKPGNYFSMLTGIGDEDPRIDMTYYHTMLHWYQQFDNNLLNDAHIIIRFNAAVRLVSMGNYHIHALFMCFLAFIGLCAMYKVVYPAVKEWRGAAAGIIFLLPSLLFWSSGVMKEGLMVFALGVIVYQFFRFFNDRKWWRIPWLLLCGWLLFVTKFYVLAALIPSLPAAIWVMRKETTETRGHGENKFPAFLKFAIALLLFFGLGLSLRWMSPVHDPLKLLAYKQNDFLKLARGGTYLLSDSVVAFIASDKREDLVKTGDSTFMIREGADYYYWYFDPDFSDTMFVRNGRDKATYTILTDFPRAGSLMEADYLQPTLLSFLRETPRAIFHVFVRPYPWEGKNPLLLLPALENLLVFLLLVLAIAFYRKPVSPGLAGFFLSFSLLLLLIMGLTTPILGALVRYRMAAQPFLLAGLLLFIDREKVLRKFPWIKKFGI